MVGTVIGFKIREQRKRLGITQAQLARNLEISAAYLNLIEANKRSVGGRLLNNLARQLKLDVGMLSGAAEQRLSDDLKELPLDPMFGRVKLSQNFADEIVAYNPDWARLLLTLYRAYLDNQQALNTLGDRLHRDPAVQASVHKMLTHITTIRSTAEILNEMQDLEASQQKRFHEVMHLASAQLTISAQQIIADFQMQETTNPSLAAAEEVDEFIIGSRNYFPKLEEAADNLSKELGKAFNNNSNSNGNNNGNNNNNTDTALIELLQNKFGITVQTTSPNKSGSEGVRNQVWFDAQAKTLHILPQAPATTRRFQVARLVAQLVCNDVLSATVNDTRLGSATAKQLAKRALSSYIAGAVLLPYDSFLQAAVDYRYDIELLKQRFDASYEQVAHRLVTLRKPSAEGVPFAFLRVNPSGFISKRFPLIGLPLPRYGYACPLWVVFSAFQTPTRVIRQLAEFPDGHRFLMIARTVTKRAATFNAQPVLFALMLACDVLHADRTVYAEGLELGSAASVERVGATCRQCVQRDCQHRQEANVSGDSFLNLKKKS